LPGALRKIIKVFANQTDYTKNNDSSQMRIIILSGRPDALRGSEKEEKG
jgi:hypothetical protein